MHEVHGKLTCSLCQGGEILIPELKFYDTIEDLREHQKQIVNGKVLHPICKLCDRIFQNEKVYLQHVKDSHFF